MSSSVSVGIDFGADCCAVAVCGGSFPTLDADGGLVAPADSGSRPTPQILVNELGQRTTPAWVQCPATTAKSGQYVVGATAQDQALRCEKRTVSAVKMALGHGLDHEQVERARAAKYWTCGVAAVGNEADAVASEEDDAGSRVAFEVWEPRAENPEATRRKVPASAIASRLFEKLQNDASSGSGKAVTGAVVAVSATATEAEIQAVKTAAQVAGFADVTTLGADIAIALAHGFDKVPQSRADGDGTSGTGKGVDGASGTAADSKAGEKCESKENAAAPLTTTKPARHILILDVGACSSTASILLCTNGVMQSVVTPVTTWGVGGWFIDDALVQLCAKQFKRQSRLDIMESRRSLAKLRRACEKAKQSLSSAKESTISIEALHEGVDFRFRLNRSRFEAECAAAITDTLLPIDSALANAGLSANDIDEAVVSGGSARIPKLQRAFAFKLNRAAPKEGLEDVAGALKLDPSETVAMGAAIHAAQLYGKEGALRIPPRRNGGGDPLAAPALPLPISLEVAGGGAVPIIPASALLPLRSVFRAAASLDGSFTLSLLEGGNPLAAHNRRLLELSCEAVPEISDASGKIAPTVHVEICVSADYEVQAKATFLEITPAEWDDAGENIIVAESARATGHAISGSCKLCGQPLSATEESAVALNAKRAFLRDTLSALDGALEAALSPEETADLEDDDVEVIQHAASLARTSIVTATQPSIAKWQSCEALQAQIDSIKCAHHTFESELKKVLSQYEEDPGEDEVDAGDDNVDVSVDSDMD
eukprot:g2734.t1